MQGFSLPHDLQPDDAERKDWTLTIEGEVVLQPNGRGNAERTPLSSMRTLFDKIEIEGPDFEKDVLINSNAPVARPPGTNVFPQTCV